MVEKIFRQLLSAYVVFKVGAEMNDGKKLLELDLAELEISLNEFRYK